MLSNVSKQSFASTLLLQREVGHSHSKQNLTSRRRKKTKQCEEIILWKKLRIIIIAMEIAINAKHRMHFRKKLRIKIIAMKIAMNAKHQMHFIKNCN